MSRDQRWTNKSIAAASLFLGVMTEIAAAQGPAASAPLPSVDPTAIGRKVALPDGRLMRITCSGRGSPTVILEAGWDGGGSYSWATLLPKVQSFTRVCAYDRAGTGFSDPGPMPRDGEHIASDLHALLRAADEKPPYVLVGHSLGGPLVRIYRVRHPRDVVALVLIDPSQPGHNQRFLPLLAQFNECLQLANRQAITRATRSCMPPVEDPPDAAVEVAQQPGYWQTAISEGEHFDACFEELAATEHAPFATPLIILTASGQAGLEGKARADWIAGHKDMAALSTHGEQRLITGSGHAIQVDRPDVVVQAIRDAIKKAGYPR